jgi:hypothetical protein
MAFKKGQSGNPEGKKTGTISHATKNAKEAIARLVDDNSERMQGWLDQIAAEQGPMAAWKCMNDVIEYHIPKLARTEHSGLDGGAIDHNLNVKFVGKQ